MKTHMRQMVLLVLISLVTAGLPFALSRAFAGDDLASGFARPPVSAKPTVYWFWLFNRVDKAGITRDLEQFKAKGISGVN